MILFEFLAQGVVQLRLGMLASALQRQDREWLVVYLPWGFSGGPGQGQVFRIKLGVLDGE